MQNSAKGGTRFAHWLNEQGMSCDVFVELYGVPRKSVFFLADPTRYTLPLKAVRFEVLTKIAEATGITAGDLVQDVVQWQ